MTDNYKTLKIKKDTHARLMTCLSKQQLKSGGKRVTICEVINKLLDIAENKDKM